MSQQGGERIAVVGAGLMGHGIAQVFLSAGHSVRVHDTDSAILATVPGRIRTNLETLGMRPPTGRLTLHERLAEAVADADVVFEAAVEDVEVKRRLFRELDEATPAGALLASNTSVIKIAEIAEGVRDRSRVIGTHWWNPPYLIPLVEVVQSAETSASVIEIMVNLLARTGKRPVHVRRDVPGFIGNRLQHALWREAFALVDEGVCDAETVDDVIRCSFGRRLAVLGPIENADLVGLDLTLAIHNYLLPHLSRSSEPSRTLREKVERGELGAKSGEGFVKWPGARAEEVQARLRSHLVNTASGEG